MRSAGTRPVTLALVCAAVCVLASCATFQRWGDQGAVKQVADYINAGKAQPLTVMSVTPFLVDGEIVPIASDVSDFWDGIVKAGFRVDGATLDQGAVVGLESYTQFAATMEVKAFFNRYVKSGSRILTLTTGAGTHVLLLMKSDWFSWKILGFKGPF
jgi:hypothetical protein